MLFRSRFIPVICLSIVLLTSSVLPLKADELDDAIKKQQQLEQQQNQAKGQLNQLTFTEDKLNQELTDLKSQISVAAVVLEQKQAEYTQAQNEVTKSEQELAQKIQELVDRRLALQKRVRGIYETGQVSYLEILFDSTDLSDFVSRLEYLTKLINNDQQLLANIQEQKDQITIKTEELKNQRDQAAKIQAQAAFAKTDLDNKKQREQAALVENKKQQQETIDDIDKLAADSKALEQTIRELQAAHNGGVVGEVTSWPLPGHYEISSPFGWRIHPITHEKSLHTGVDIPAPSGTPIHATGDGVVIYAGWYGAYGNTVIIDHGKSISSLYGHQSRLAVSLNKEVKAGQIIGYVGTTGWSTGPHLHFEIRVDGNPTDPLQYFK